MVLGLSHTQRGFMRSGALLAAAGLALIALAGLDGCAKTKDSAAPVHATVVNYAVVKLVSAPVQITGTGTVEAWQEVDVGAETGGLTAISLQADEGQSVTQGQPLLRMDDVLLQAQVKQAAANADQARKAYDRANTLFKQGYLSAAALDQAQASMLTTEAGKETAETQLSLATVRAPVSGIVTERKAVLGQIVQQGAELFKIVRDGRVELNMQVVEADLQGVRPGMPVTVSSESNGQVTGTVRIVTPQVDPQTRLGLARVSVPWSSGLRPGMFATGTIDAGVQEVLSVPQSAVVYSENLPAVLLIGADNKVSLQKVTLGAHVGKDVVVKDGLNAGQRVVTTGAGFLNSGDTVKLAPAQQGGE